MFAPANKLVYATPCAVTKEGVSDPFNYGEPASAQEESVGPSSEPVRAITVAVDDVVDSVAVEGLERRG